MWFPNSKSLSFNDPKCHISPSAASPCSSWSSSWKCNSPEHCCGPEETPFPGLQSWACSLCPGDNHAPALPRKTLGTQVSYGPNHVHTRHQSEGHNTGMDIMVQLTKFHEKIWMFLIFVVTDKECVEWFLNQISIPTMISEGKIISMLLLSSPLPRTLTSLRMDSMVSVEVANRNLQTSYSQVPCIPSHVVYHTV